MDGPKESPSRRQLPQDGRVNATLIAQGYLKLKKGIKDFPQRRGGWYNYGHVDPIIFYCRTALLWRPTLGG